MAPGFIRSRVVAFLAAVIAASGGCADAIQSFPDARDAQDVGDAGLPETGPSSDVLDADGVTACPTGQSLCGTTCVSLATSTMHCGTCGNACASGANATATCTSGACRLECAAGFGDCDGMSANGCETPTATDVRHCGRCHNSCSPQPNATPTCAMGACALACVEGLGNCDGDAMNGCETVLATSGMHCGRCGVACPSGSMCVAGACAMVSTSCRALHVAAPALPSGAYLMDFDGLASTPPVSVYCDMTTAGGGWTLVAASAGGVNMPKFDTMAATACANASPTSPCFIGAANLAALTFTDFAWSTGPSAVNDRGPIDRMLTGAPTASAICVSATEYYRFNQDDASQGMGWTGCMPTEYYLNRGFCESSLRNVWNLLTCDGLTVAPGTRSSPDYSCSPFGRTHPFGPADLCTEFMNIRHWRR